MPTRVQLPDGNIGEFPDGMDNAAIEAVLQKQFPSPNQTPSASPFAGDTARPLTARERFLNPNLYPVGNQGEGVGENIKNLANRAGVGVFQLANAVAHPRQTVAGLLSSVLPDQAVQGVNKVVDLENKIPGAHYLTTKLPEGTPNPIQSGYEAVSHGPLQAAASAAPVVGQMLAGAALPEVAAGVANDVPAAAQGVLRSITHTGPNVTKDLVKDTQAANETAIQKATDVNTDLATKRAAEVQKVGQKRIAVQKQNEAQAGIASRKAALQRGVEQLDPQLKGELEKTETSVNTEANRRYNELADKLNPVEADPSFLEDALTSASEKIKGSDTSPAILKDMEKKMTRGEVLTYEDLQGYRSEIGRELRKGSLPGDVFYAYKGLMNDITNEMERVAGDNGLGDQFRDARDYYRRYAETFIDRTSPVRKALDSTERGGVAKALKGKDQSGIQAVAQFDPTTAQRLNTLRGLHEEATGIKVPTTGPKPLPQLSPKTPPVVPETSTISPEDIKAAKTEAIQGRVDKLDKIGSYGIAGMGGTALFFLARQLMHGNLAALPEDIAAAATVYGTKTAFEQFMKNPKVQEFLTKPTAADVAQIPPELQGDMSQIAQAASRNGIKVDPRLLGSISAASPKKRVASALSK